MTDKTRSSQVTRSGLSGSSGYLVDAAYPDHFYRELSPVWIAYVAALGSTSSPDLTKPFSYLELGCGLGSSLVVNAAAYPQATFHGCDLNPEHIAGARRHAEVLGLRNVTFHELAFAALLEQPLPRFDFIVIHGVYSWVDDDVRASIRHVLEVLLVEGGLAYVSYNCLPGWANEAPLRKLIVELARPAEGDSVARARVALAALQPLSVSTLRYFKANPSAVTAVDAYAKRPASYVAHDEAVKGGVLQKLVFHSTGDLCGDWMPNAQVIKNYFEA